eukprot:TRINITY_DN23968_c0_g2_i1.p1 TRINITY_DN23968_c0_g2~~TRINITY_DN23968_c0_g2_i1.p1  ORF type:complete len:255 (-),score=47.74 TRINITY_DN23968_c0_g2_i1:147-911(-)
MASQSHVGRTSLPPMSMCLRPPPGLSPAEMPVRSPLGFPFHTEPQSIKYRQRDVPLSPRSWLADEVAFVQVEDSRAAGIATAAPHIRGEEIRKEQDQLTVRPVARDQAFSLSCEVPPLVRSAGKGDFTAVHNLLNDGEDPDSQDDLGMSALHCAAKKGNLQIVSILITRGADANAQAIGCKGEVPLHYAAKYGHKQVLEVLLRGRADPAMATKDGRTALDYARDQKQTACEERLFAFIPGSQAADTEDTRGLRL